MTTHRMSTARSTDADSVLADLVDRITRCIQNGQPLDLDAVERDHPDQIDQLRKLLPALETLADLNEPTAGARTRQIQAADDTGNLRVVLGDYHILRKVGRGRPGGGSRIRCVEGRLNG